MLTLYGIKSCDTCRRARKYLADEGIEFRFHDVRDDGLDISMLRRWAQHVDWDVLLNRKSLTWRKIPEVDRQGLNQDRAFSLIADQPTLLKRPVLESDHALLVGFSEANYRDMLSRKP